MTAFWFYVLVGVSHWVWLIALTPTPTGCRDVTAGLVVCVVAWPIITGLLLLVAVMCCVQIVRENLGRTGGADPPPESVASSGQEES